MKSILMMHGNQLKRAKSLPFSSTNELQHGLKIHIWFLETFFGSNKNWCVVEIGVVKSRVRIKAHRIWTPSMKGAKKFLNSFHPFVQSQGWKKKRIVVGGSIHWSLNHYWYLGDRITKRRRLKLQKDTSANSYHPEDLWNY